MWRARVVLALALAQAVGGAARLPARVRCADPACSGPISKAKTLIPYHSGDADLISFPSNADAIVYMKAETGENDNLWNVEINGRKGFVPSNFLREYKIIVKNPPHILPVFRKGTELASASTVQADKVQQPHDVVDGTTIQYDPEDTEQSVSTEGIEINILNNVTPQLYTGETFTEVASTPTATEDPPKEITTEYMPDKEDINEFYQNYNQPNDQNTENVAPLESLHQIKDSVDSIVADQVPLADINGNIDVGKENKGPSMNNEDIVTAKLDAADINKEVIAENKIQATGQTENHSPQVEEIPVAQPLQLINDAISESSIPEINPQIPDLNKIHFKEVIAENKIPATEQTKNLSPQVEEIPVAQPLQLINDAISESSIPEINPQIPDLNQIPLVEKIQISTKENIAIELKASGDVQTSNTDNDTPGLASLDNYESGNTGQKTNAIEVIELLDETAQPELVHSENITEIETNISNSEQISVVFNDIPMKTGVKHTQSVDEPPAKMEESPSTEPTIASATHSEPMMKQSPLLESIENQLDSVLNSIPPDIISTEQPDEPIGTTKTEKIPSYSDAPTTEVPYVYTESIESSTEQSVDPYNANEDVVEHFTPVKESLFSGIFTIVSSLWPGTAESPEIAEFPKEENVGSHFAPDHDKGHNTFEKILPEKTENIMHSIDDMKDEFSVVEYIWSVFNSVIKSTEETRALFIAPGETCLRDDYCDLDKPQNNRLFVFLTVTAASVLIFTLGYYYIDNKRQDGRLVAMVNTLQRDLLCTTKECEILKEELTNTKGKLAGIEDSSFGMDDMVQSLKREIEEWKLRNEKLRTSLDDNEKLLRVSENTASELQNTLGDLENTLGELLSERGSSEDQITELNEKIQVYEEELVTVSRERDSFQLKLVSSEKAVEELKKLPKQIDELVANLKEANNTIELQHHELTALKDLLKQMQSGNVTTADVSSLIDQSEVKAKLAKALEEKTTFESKYQTEQKECTRLQEELDSVKQALSVCEQRASESSTRLEVLGKYFQEREGELLKELSTKEALWLSKQGESTSTVEKMEALQQEVRQYKEMCESARRELAEQEAERRTAVAALEARAHAAWLEARAAKRDAAADREEAAALRRKMASLAHSPEIPLPHQRVASPLEAGAVDGVVPPPLPPMAFLPPPLLPPLPRPPPLGRLPSPGPPPRYGDRRYTPESRYSPDSRFSPETVRYSPDSRYSPDRSRRSPYVPRRHYSRESYYDERSPVRQRNGHMATETETDYSPPASPPPRRRGYSKRSGPSSGSGCSSESNEK